MQLEDFEALCLPWPGAQLSLKLEDHLCFTVGDKIFLFPPTGPHYHCTFKASAEDFKALIQRHGVRPAPYLGRSHWIQVQEPGALTKVEWAHYVRQSYEQVAARLPKKLQREIGLGN